MKVSFTALSEQGSKDKYELKFGLPDAMWWNFRKSNLNKIRGTTYGIQGEMYL